MKEKVERLAKGIFEYETPGILLSEEELVIAVDPGQPYFGSFTIKNTKDTPMKGVLYSSNELLRLEQDRFGDKENKINYGFYGDNMIPGEITKGEICIVSDCGEIILPFTVNTLVPYLNSPLGKIKDLFNFTNLAKSDWSKAIKLLKANEFRQILMYHDLKYLLLYEHIIKSKSNSQALEEFLIAIRKKLHINIIVDKNVLNYQVGTESFMDKVTLMKDNWGYAEIRISTDAPFITLEHKIIWSDYFIGNTYPIEFVLNPEKMRQGKNYGRIYLATIHETMVVEVTCEHNIGTKEKEVHHKKIKEDIVRAVQNYLGFRRNILSLEEYIDQTSGVLNELITLDKKNKDLYQLVHTHLLIISGKEAKAKQALEELKDKADKWKDSSLILYSGYLYLLALQQKENTTIEEALSSIKNHYEKDSYDWRLLWLLLYLDKRYDQNKALKLDDIKEQFNQGCHSPVLYYEAVVILNEEPVLLHELGNFELQVLYWGICNDYVNENTALQFTYLAGKKKQFHRLVYTCLVKLYEKYQMKDILFSICSLLIKGHKRRNKYFNWYRLGVLEQLRITELYEYYMYSLEENADIALPQPVLLYFIYNSNLNDRKKAYLYAYIVKNKENLPTIYHNYYKRMEQFALKLIKEHVITNDLALIYEEIITQEGLLPEIAVELPYIMFKHEVGCNNEDIKGVCIVHKEGQEEVYAPFINGVAQVDIYTENTEIFLVDGHENRYHSTISYTLNRLMHWEYYVNACYDLGVTHPYVLLNLSEKAQTYQKFDDQSVETRKLILGIKGLNETYCNQIILDLIQFYYDNFQGELLEIYLMQIKLKGLKKEERNKITELFIIRDLYDKALTALEEFGYEGIAVKRLIKLCAYLLQNQNMEEDGNHKIVSLSYHIFKAGKYNEEILKYLVKYFFGTTAEMYQLWETAVAFELDTTNLEERLLGQMLFAESYITNSMSVFLQYYKRGTNHTIIKAFITYNAYRYLVMDRLIQKELFDVIKKELVYEENEVCMLALLKKYSQETDFTEEEIKFIDYKVHTFAKMGIKLPFFKNFQDVININSKIKDRFYVEYRTNPAHKVTIHYRLDDKNSSEEFTSEDMKNIYLGIHMKEFVLFYNERIQYYITEEDQEGQIVITESVNVELGQDMKLEEDTRYNQLNFMLTAMEMQDDKTVLDSICNYSKTNYVISDIFKPL